MRKIICIIILSCLIIDMTGSWLMFGVFRQSAKSSMQLFFQTDYNKKEEINFLITPQNAVLFALNDEDELSFNGILYDITHKTQVADTMHITCLMDTNETVLVNNYNNAYFNCIQNKDRGSVKPFHLFYSVYEPVLFKIQLANIISKIHLYRFINPDIYNAMFAIVKPPPKVIA